MATLTETAYYSRKFIKWGSIGLICFIILRILFIFIVAEIRKAFPPPALVPNNAFGKLPKVSFPENQASSSESSQLTFTLQTVSADIPKASDAARVFFMPKDKSNLLSLSRSQNFVSQIDFTATPKLVDTNTYLWTDINNPLRTIEINVVSNHFVLNYAYSQDLTLFQEKQIYSPTAAIKEVMEFFKDVSINIPDIDFTKTKITYLKLLGNILEPTSSQSQADAVKVELFRADYYGFPVLTENPNTGIASFIFSGSTQPNKRVLYVKYRYWPINTNYMGIYKLKTSQEVWTELNNGKGYIALNKLDKTQIPISRIYLALYDSEQPQLFLQPVFVFTFEDKFMALVSAVAPPWTE